MLDVEFVLNSIENYIKEHGEDTLYENGFFEKEPNKFNELIEKTKNLKGEELANVLVESLDEDERSEVLVEEVIEHLSNNYDDFEILIDDLELQNYTPIYLLEKYNKIDEA